MAPNLAPAAAILDKSFAGGVIGSQQQHRHPHNFAENAFFGNTAGGQNNSTDGATAADLVALALSESQSQRSAVLILSIFGLLASILIISSLLYDTFRVRSGEIYNRAQKYAGSLNIFHPAEVFPFILALATLVQTSIFIAAENRGLGSFWVDGCRETAERVWPAVWAVVLTILAYGVETTIRSLRKSRFSPRNEWVTPACVAAVSLSLSGLWLVSYLMPSLDICLGSLIWWTSQYSKIGAVLALVFLLATLLCGGIITAQLLSTTDVDRDERIAASRVVYSLAVNVLVLVFVVPYWIQRIVGVFPVQSSVVAEIGLSLTGIFLGMIHLLLRSNAERLFGPNDLGSKMFISTPLLQKEDVHREQWNDNAKAEKFEAAAAAATAATAEAQTPNSTNYKPPMRITHTEGPRSPPIGLPPSPSPRQNPTQPLKTAQVGRARAKSSYSIFPSQTPPRPSVTLASLSSAGAQSAYPYGEEMIAMPNPAFARRHERQDSTMTSATVEIGLRLSHALSDSTEDSERRTEGTQDLRNASIVSAFIDPPAGRRRSSSYPVAAARAPSRFLEPSNFVRNYNMNNYNMNNNNNPPRMSSKAPATSVPAAQQQKQKMVLNNMKVLPPIPPPNTDRDLLPSALRSHPLTLPSSPSPRKKAGDWI